MASPSGLPDFPNVPSSSLNDYCGGELIGTSIGFMVLGCVIVTLRFYTRISTAGLKLGFDDYLTWPALLANMGVQITCIVLVIHGGVGYHIEYWEIHDPYIIFNWSKIVFALQLVYMLAVCTGKLAVLAIYARNFPSKQMLSITYVLAGIVIATWLGCSMATIFESVPVGCQWDVNATTSTCVSIDILAFFRYMSVPTILTDVAILILPIPKIWQLTLSRSEKIGLTGVFLTGSVGLVASCIRFAVFLQTNAFVDATWASCILNVWTVTEPGVYLIASCLPPLRPLFLSATHRLQQAGLSWGRKGAREDVNSTSSVQQPHIKSYELDRRGLEGGA